MTCAHQNSEIEIIEVPAVFGTRSSPRLSWALKFTEFHLSLKELNLFVISQGLLGLTKSSMRLIVLIEAKAPGPTGALGTN